MAVEPYRDEVEVIFLTHGHYDHTAHVREIAHMCDATIAIHADDAAALLEDHLSLSLHFGARSPGIVPDRVVREGDEVGGVPRPPHARATPPARAASTTRSRATSSRATRSSPTAASAGTTSPAARARP